MKMRLVDAFEMVVRMIPVMPRTERSTNIRTGLASLLILMDLTQYLTLSFNHTCSGFINSMPPGLQE